MRQGPSSSKRWFNWMIKLGLTGSIAMGKSTTTGFFRNLGIPVYDADAAVHDIYQSDGVEVIRQQFPGAIIDGKVDRVSLSKLVMGDPENLKILENMIHPLVREREQKFLQDAQSKNHKLVVMDIPLLFETKGQNRVDKILVVTAPSAIQKQRALARPNMSEAKLNAILSRQITDAVKRKKADYVIDTSFGMIAVQNQVKALVKKLVGDQDG